MASPAADNPCYQLATLAETSLHDTAVNNKNRHLWNGYQRVLLGDQFKSDDPHMAALPELSEDYLGIITAIEGLLPTPNAFVKIDFQGVAFPDVTFQGFYFGFGARFDNATFGGEVAFTDAPQTYKAAPMSFEQANFTQYPPKVQGREMHENTDWTWAVWPNAPSHRGPLDDHINAYQRLQLIAWGLGKVDDEHRFFRKELDCKRKLAAWPAKPFYWGCKLASDYGHSYLRPLGGIFGLWRIWAVGYTDVFLHKNGYGLLRDKPQILWEAAGLSFANIFAFFGFDRRL